MLPKKEKSSGLVVVLLALGGGVAILSCLLLCGGVGIWFVAMRAQPAAPEKIVVQAKANGEKSKGDQAKGAELKKVPDPPEEKKAKTPVDFSMTAAAFVNEVDADPNSAGKKYGGRAVELTGKITMIARHPFDPKGMPQIQVGEKGTTDVVICNTMDRQPWRKCAPEQTIKIRGKMAR
jgi:hypothetical protein